jgi:hypothetical protein
MRKAFFVFTIALTLAMSSCDVLQQVSQMATFAKCDFRLESVQQLSLSGVNVQNVKKASDLSLLDYGKLATAVATQQFPLDFTLNLEARNPNTSPASMTKVDWILLIDNIEMTRGSLDKQVTVPSNNGVSIIPMNMRFDLKQVLSGKSADAIINFGMNLAGTGSKPTRFTLQMKPTLSVAGIPVTYPGYINVSTDFTNK